MPGTSFSFSCPAEWPGRIHIGCEAWRVDLLSCGNEYHIHAERLEHMQITRQVSWVTFQVFVWAKLGWVNEDTCQEHVILLTPASPERNMSLVEISHSGNKSDLFAANPSRALMHHLTNCGGYCLPSVAS